MMVESTEDGQEPRPPCIGVALGGGGTAGLSAVGVLHELRAAGIVPGVVAGTSAGAGVGAAFAAGELELFEHLMTGLTSRQALAYFDPTWPRQGLFQAQKAIELIRPAIGERIEDLLRPFAAVAADLDSGEEVILDHGPVTTAVRASMAIPGIFTPQLWNGRWLVDGGLVEPVPVDAARALGADFVIAVTTLPLADTLATGRRLPRTRTANECSEDSAHAEAGGILDILAKSSRLIQSQIARARFRLDPPDFIVQPEAGQIGLFEFHRAREAIESGRSAARDALPQLVETLRSRGLSPTR